MKKWSRDPTHRTSDWNGAKIPLKKFSGSLTEYAAVVRSVTDALWYPLAPQCAWTNIPLMIKAIEQQTKIFEAAGMHDSTFYTDLVSHEEFMAKAGCSVRKFLQEHGE
jgi:hypothetical protein